MKTIQFKSILPEVQSYQEYDSLKRKVGYFESAIEEIISYHNLPDLPFEILNGSNIVFACGDKHIIKLYPPMLANQFRNELLVMRHISKKLSVLTPIIEYSGEISDWPYIIMSKLKGVLLEDLWETLDYNNKIIILRELGVLIREVHSLSIDGLESIDCHWEKFILTQIQDCLNRHRKTGLPDMLLQQLPTYLKTVHKDLPNIIKPVLLTGEYTPMNLLVTQKNETWHINGLIDFGDSMLGLPAYDLIGPGTFLIQGDKKLLREFLISYGFESELLTPTLSKQLTALMFLHKHSNLKIQIRIKYWESRVKTITDIENLVWGF